MACISCKNDKWYFNRWCWIDDKGDTCHIKIKFCPLCGENLEKDKTDIFGYTKDDYDKNGMPCGLNYDQVIER